MSESDKSAKPGRKWVYIHKSDVRFLSPTVFSKRYTLNTEMSCSTISNIDADKFKDVHSSMLTWLDSDHQHSVVYFNGHGAVDGPANSFSVSAEEQEERDEEEGRAIAYTAALLDLDIACEAGAEATSEPVGAQWLSSLLRTGDESDEIVGDLVERFAFDLPNKGRPRAMLCFWMSCMHVIIPDVIARFKARVGWKRS